MLLTSGIEAVAAVIEAGSFEGAAGRLGITPSAVSQRIKAAEEQLGVALIIRGRPCTGTNAGQRILRYVTETRLLQNELTKDLGHVSGDRPTIKIAVNADSLATWFLKSLADVEGLLFHVALIDQDRSADLLRRGEVLAALGRSGATVAGCDQMELGVFRYVASARPSFVEKWFPNGITLEALRIAPSLRFGPDDRLQEEWAQTVTNVPMSLPHHVLPSSQGFIDACVSGLGWGMNPLESIKRQLEHGELVRLTRAPYLDVPLSWRWIRAASKGLRPLNEAVRRNANQALRSSPVRRK